MSPVTAIRVGILGLLALVCFALAGCEPCHRQHARVVYVAQHEECDTDYFEIGDVSFPITTCSTVPAKCVTYTLCDEQCRAIDAGKLEAHAKHVVLNGPTDSDPECR